MDDKFAKGIFFKSPADNAPDFVIGRLSIKTEEFFNYVNSLETDGWVNLDIKRGKSGKPYLELNTWKPTKGDGIPF